MNTTFLIGEIIEQVVRKSVKVIGGKATEKLDKKVIEQIDGLGLSKEIGRTLWKNKAAAIDIGFGIHGYYSAKDRGEGIAGRLGQASEDALIPYIAGPMKYLGVELLLNSPDIALDIYQKSSSFGRSLAGSSNSTFNNAKFQDSEEIATMRQAGMALAESSQFNLKKAMLGNEARYM